MENNTEISTPSLLCLEDSNTCFGDSPSMWDHKNLNLNNQCLVNSNLGSEPIVGFLVLSDETVWCLVEREKDHLPHHDYLNRLSGGDLDLITLRNEALERIFKANAYHGFGASCFCLAVNYLDRYLSVKESTDEDNGWAVQLLGQACLSIAAKTEESNVPKPIKFQVGESKPPFDARAFRRIELLVLNTLKWKMQSLTACTFIEYFLRKMTCLEEHDEYPSITSVWKSLDLLPKLIKCIEFLEFKPSEIATATAIFVSGEKQAKEIDDALASLAILDKEKILKCVELIRDFSLGRISRKSKSPIGVLDLDAECMSSENDELIDGGSYANSPTENSNAKRHKSGGESFQDGSF